MYALIGCALFSVQCLQSVVYYSLLAIPYSLSSVFQTKYVYL